MSTDWPTTSPSNSAKPSSIARPNLHTSSCQDILEPSPTSSPSPIQTPRSPLRALADLDLRFDPNTPLDLAFFSNDSDTNSDRDIASATAASGGGFDLHSLDSCLHDRSINWDPLSALLLSPQSPTGSSGHRTANRSAQAPFVLPPNASAPLSAGVDLDLFLSSSSLLPHILPSAAAAAPAPFAPTAAVIYPPASSHLSSSHTGPIPVSAPHAFDAAPTYRLVIEVVTNILAASPRPRALPAGCISCQVVSGRYQFYSPDPALLPTRLPRTSDSADNSSSITDDDDNDDDSDDSDDSDEFAATDPSRDARLCTIIIDSWTMVERSSPVPSLDDLDNVGSVQQLASNDGRHPRHKRSSNRPPSPAPRARFESTHEGTAHIACGILHLYREQPQSSAPPSLSTRPPSPTSVAVANDASTTTTHTASTNLLALLGVPQYLTAADLITWLGPFVDHISHLRMIHDHLPSRYLVLLRFREGAQARAFFSERNGRAFSAFEPQLALIVKVTSLTFTASSVPPFAFPHDVLCVDPAASTSATAATAAARLPVPSSPSAQQQRSPSSSTPTNPQPSSPTVDLHELPTCPVCLERMDAGVTGLMTILCQHTFHCGCLRRWDGTACPVCRYTQQGFPDVPGAAASALSPAPSTSTAAGAGGVATRCTTCAGTSDLWACLVCGRIGCGRYASGHARDHFADSGHAFALELESHRVWDYARDQYVHRLVQAGPEGKLVEVAPLPHHGVGMVTAGAAGAAGPSAASGGWMAAAVTTGGGVARHEGDATPGNAYAPPPGYMVVAEADITRINKEYAWLLQSQVDAHRQVLEAQAARLTVWAGKVRQHVVQVQRRAAKAEAVLGKVQAELAEERAVSQGLATANRELKGEVERRDEVIRELEEQVRDLMVFVETREKIEKSSAEVQKELASGQVVGVGGGGEVKKGKRGKKGKGKAR